MLRAFVIGCVCASALLSPLAAPLNAQKALTIPDDSVRRMLTRAVTQARTTGVVVGLVERDGRRRVFAAGSSGSNARLLDGESVFEIGSITKVFTGILLADMARRGEVQLSDPVAKYVPADVTIPARNGKQITLLDIATHFSGLPRMPGNFAPKDPKNPYADYTLQQLYDFASGYELGRDRGASFEYSNYAMGLLGAVLAARAGMSYEQLVTARILAPLGMKNTAIVLTDRMKANLALGHNQFGDTTSNWDIPAMAGAGALRSTVNDMLLFAAANLKPDNSSLGDAIRDALQARRQLEGSDSIGLNWIMGTRGGTRITWHNGGTGGYATFLGLDRAGGRAAVVLSNTGGLGLDDVGLHLLSPSLPLRKPDAAAAVGAAYRSGGIQAVVDRYQTLKREQRDNYAFDEAQLDRVGYWLLGAERAADAVVILQLNAHEYPDAPNPFDSLGDALEAAGRIDEARASYQRAVGLAEKTGDARTEVFRSNLQKFEARRNAGAVCTPTTAPALDHTILVVRDLDAAARPFRSAGFRFKNGRLHANGLLNRHIKFRDGTEIELQTVQGKPGDAMAERYQKLLEAGEGGVYVALKAKDISEIERHAANVGLGMRRSGSGPWQFLAFVDSSTAEALFFSSGDAPVADADSIFAHEPAVTQLAEVWLEGGPKLNDLLRRLGAGHCGTVVAPDGRTGDRWALSRGRLVIVPPRGNTRPRVLGAVLETPGADTRRIQPHPNFWIEYN
jgi:serine-type D-Ala-D-Ala carboxypeptidase/endopeptidase